MPKIIKYLSEIVINSKKITIFALQNAPDVLNSAFGCLANG